MRDRDAFRGCLIGGAAGDALGYAVEFLREGRIFSRYGELGITEYELTGGVAEISDDTQMTLFTAGGLLLGTARGTVWGSAAPDPDWIALCYQDWLKTQENRYPLRNKTINCWLANVPALFSRRAPGNTCLAALYSARPGTTDMPVNNSKGCGGVMRVAPVGLYFCDRSMDPRDICRVGAQAAAVTHGHPLGWLPAAALAQIVYEVSQDRADLGDAVGHALDTVRAVWPGKPETETFTRLMEKAVELSGEEMDDLDGIHQLGEGWVAEETLAIAVYCALKYPGDIDRVLIAAVNHNGDSDSTGAVAGNIVGAQAGLSGIPKKYTEKLEMRDLILEVADDLWRDCRPGAGGGYDDPVWEQKYIDATYGRP